METEQQGPRSCSHEAAYTQPRNEFAEPKVWGETYHHKGIIQRNLLSSHFCLPFFPSLLGFMLSESADLLPPKEGRIEGGDDIFQDSTMCPPLSPHSSLSFPLPWAKTSLPCQLCSSSIKEGLSLLAKPLSLGSSLSILSLRFDFNEKRRLVVLM